MRPLKSRGEMGAFDPAKSWKDVNFTRVPVTGLLRAGRNSVVIEGEKVNNITGPCRHIGVANFNDVKVGDVIEAFVTERVAAEMTA